MDQIGEWFEDNRRVFFHQFKSGLNQTYVQMIPLNRFEHYQVRIFYMNLQQFTILTKRFQYFSLNSLSMSKQLTLIQTTGCLVVMPLKCMIIRDIGKLLKHFFLNDNEIDEFFLTKISVRLGNH